MAATTADLAAADAAALSSFLEEVPSYPIRSFKRVMAEDGP